MHFLPLLLILVVVPLDGGVATDSLTVVFMDPKEMNKRTTAFVWMLELMTLLRELITFP